MAKATIVTIKSVNLKLDEEEARFIQRLLFSHVGIGVGRSNDILGALDDALGRIPTGDLSPYTGGSIQTSE